MIDLKTKHLVMQQRSQPQVQPDDKARRFDLMARVFENLCDATRGPGGIVDEWYGYLNLPFLQLFGVMLRGHKMRVLKSDPFYEFFRDHVPAEVWDEFIDFESRW